MKRRLVSIFLALAILLPMLGSLRQRASAVTSVSKTDDEIITAVMEYLNIKEGNCDSVNPDDNGAVSIGMIQWHATRALNILKQIIALIPDDALEILGEALYNEILTAKSWESRTVTPEEQAALEVLLATDESIRVQVAQARSDLRGYLAHAKRMGMVTPAMQFYFMDIENQYGGGGAELMLRYAKETAGTGSFSYLYQFHAALLMCSYNSVQNYIQRRISTYTYIVNKLHWESVPPVFLTSDGNGGQGNAIQRMELAENGSFTFPENPYARTGYAFAGWNLHRLDDDTWYIANIGWCTPGWIEKQGYVKALYQPGQFQKVDSKFLSSAPPGATYALVAVWEPVETTLPVTSFGCTHLWRTSGEAQATCTSGGHTSYFCEKCGRKEQEDTALPNGHSYGAWQTLQAAVCGKSGLRSRVCAVCGLTQTETVPALTHQAGAPEQTLAPTCTAEGQRVIRCQLCDEILETQALPATGHTPGSTVKDQTPTCTVPGWEHQSCAVCSTVIYAAELPAQHSFGDWQEYTPATEMGDGARLRQCAVCGYTELQRIPGGTHCHTYQKTTVMPTCTAEGYDLFTCACGDSYRENTVPAAGHRTVDTPTPATCISSGFALRTCTVCRSTWLEHGQNALGHNWDGGTVRQAATADMEGEKIYTCTRCQAQRTERLPATGTCIGGASCPGHGFTDMPSGWAHAGLDFCIERGLLSGTSATTLSPNTVMSRAMLVTVLYSLEGKPSVSSERIYSDVPQGSWYEKAVRWASDCQLVSGTGNGCFTPNGAVTREQIAAILFRYAIYKDCDFSASAELAGYPDWEKASVYARAGLKWAVGAGCISGKLNGGKTYLDPQGKATRAEVASVLMSLIRKVTK